MTEEKFFKEKLKETYDMSRLRKSKFNVLVTVGIGTALLLLGNIINVNQDLVKFSFVAIGVLVIAGGLVDYLTIHYLVKQDKWYYSPIVAIKRRALRKF